MEMISGKDVPESVVKALEVFIANWTKSMVLPKWAKGMKGECYTHEDAVANAPVYATVDRPATLLTSMEEKTIMSYAGYDLRVIADLSHRGRWTLEMRGDREASRARKSWGVVIASSEPYQLLDNESSQGWHGMTIETLEAAKAEFVLFAEAYARLPDEYIPLLEDMWAPDEADYARTARDRIMPRSWL